MRTAPHARIGTATLAIALACAASMGCEPSVNRGQTRKPEAEPASQQQPQQPFGTIPEGGSKSALGKSRDAAVRVRDKMQQRDAEIGQMADDVFKNP